MDFEIISDILNIETIAIGKSIRENSRLNRFYGKARWRKLKGIAKIKIQNQIYKAEIHWYEAHGIGKKEFKIKRILRND